MDNPDRYLLTCRNNYFAEIRPSDNNSNDNPGYKALIEIAQSYFNKGKLKEFSDFFMEGQYYIELWTAHLILEFGKPDIKLSEACIDIIEKYSSNTIDPKVATQEKKWLDNYKSNKRKNTL